MLRRQRPGDPDGEAIQFLDGREYELKEGEFKGLMSRHRSAQLGRLVLVERAKPKATTTAPKSSSKGSSSSSSSTKSSSSSSSSSGSSPSS
jgi:hypothetical protein